MSRELIFAIVEGKVLDPTFYDLILDAHPGVKDAGYQIWLAEQIVPDKIWAINPGEAGAGGKEGALRLFDFYKSRGQLTIASRAGAHKLIFMLDRDFDQIAGRLKRSAHVMYTKACDVEAEVSLLGNVEFALRASLSLTRREAAVLARSVDAYVLDLAILWKEWITIAATVSACDLRCGINSGKYGPLNQSALSGVLSKLHSSASSHGQSMGRLKQLEGRVAAAYARGEGMELVKGKWLSDYLVQTIRDYFGSVPIDYSTFTYSFLRLMMESIDTTHPRLDHYYTSLDKVIAA
jgi:hypothetical protein